ncbi:MAG: hypothetical protein JST75_05280 [Bacteroidetes bacterium]|nr:hypothetical protein [Bacteroidota bacterium]
MRFFYLSILIFFLPILLSAEDLDGIWKGTMTQEPGGCYPQYFIELQLNFSNNQITGKAYDYYDTGKFVKLSFTGEYNPQTHRVILTENKVLQSQIPDYCIPCIKTYDLVYSKQEKDELLSGEWQGHVDGSLTACPPGKIFLKKTQNSDFVRDIEQNDTLETIQRSIHLMPREKEIVKTVIVESPKIKIQLYDNGEIDNDTITVFINNKLLLYRQRLTDKPLVIDFTAFPDTDYELVMYADNLGSIPPNTALMIFTVGRKKFEAFLSSSEQKSATVKFRYRTSDKTD